MKDIFELSETAIANVKGSTQLAGYTLEPAIWLKELIDASKAKHFFAQFAKQSVVPNNTTSVVFPYRTAYLAAWEADAAENAEVNWTTLNNLDGIEVVPADHNAGIAISDRAIRRNALDLVRSAKDELMYRAGDLVDLAVRDALTASSNQAGASTRGAYTVYGGDARAESELAAGDTLTPDHLVEAKTKLHSKILKYWTPATPAAEAVSSVVANPWQIDNSEPFVAIISPEQEGTLLKDSQFMNAAEYGSNEVLMNGEIGKFVGLKIITSANTRAFTTSSALDGGSNAGANGHRCVVFKAIKAMGLAWGQKPRLRVFDWPSELQKRMVLDLAYAATTIHKDSICYIDVADQ